MLAKLFRFHGHNSLSYVYRNGTTVRSRFVSLKYSQNKNRQESRVAVVVAKKVTKKAPVRNRIRRRLFEAIRRKWGNIKPGHDIVVTAFDERLATVEAAEIEAIVEELLTNAKLYK